MKVLNLRCANGHGFEGWFGSDDDYADQHARGLVECPLCGDGAGITRMPTAPRLNLSGARAPAAPQAGADRGKAPALQAVQGPPSAPGPHQAPAAGAPPQVAAGSGAGVPAAGLVGEAAASDLPRAWLAAVRRVMANTEDVGPRFAEEARRIHYGETPHRGIRGQATPEERLSLEEEGIETMALPLPRGLLGPVQ